MAEKKRTLNAEKHPDPDDGIVDAEVITTFTQRTRERFSGAGRAWKSRKNFKNKGSVDPPQESTGKRRHKKNSPDMSDFPRPEEDELAHLKLQTLLAQVQFINDLRASGITSPGESRPTQSKKLSDLHQAYASMMVLQCLSPLQRGLSAETMLSTVSMGTAMWLLSPNFRTQVGDYAGQIATAISERLDRRARRDAKVAKKGEKSRRKEAQHFAKTGQGREGMRGLAGRLHRKRLYRYERMKRGDRDLYTEHSAALTHVGIIQNAYDEMRKPGVDRDLIRKNYESALNALYGFVDQDGLDRKVVERNMRIITGQLITRYPEQAAVFSELGHGQFIKTEPQPVILEGTAQQKMAWTGDYFDAYKGRVITGGTFTLREPMDVDEHRAAVARTMYGELSSVTSSEEFSKVLEQYVIGSLTREYPASAELSEDGTERARLNRARAMFASMRGDGISEQDQKLVYMGGFIESLQTLENTHPDLVAQWRKSLGPAWEQRMRDLIEKYSEFGEEAARNRGQHGARVWVEQERGSAPGSGDEAHVADVDADIADAEVVDDRMKSAQPGSPPRGWRPGATPQPPAAESAGALGSTTVKTHEACHKVGLVDEHGSIDIKRLSEMESKGVSLERAARKKGDWYINEDNLFFARDSHARRVILVEAISDHIAKDITRTVQHRKGKNLTQSMWPVVRVWRDRRASLGPVNPSLAKPASKVPLKPWGSDEASNTRARELKEMANGMGFITIGDYNHLYALGYVRALEKVVAAEPACEEFVRKLVSRDGGSPHGWRQHEYEVALKNGYSGRRVESYQRELERLRLDPVVKHSDVDPKSEKTGEYQSSNGMSAGQERANEDLLSASNPIQENELELGG